MLPDSFPVAEDSPQLAGSQCSANPCLGPSFAGGWGPRGRGMGQQPGFLSVGIWAPPEI